MNDLIHTAASGIVGIADQTTMLTRHTRCITRNVAFDNWLFVGARILCNTHGVQAENNLHINQPISHADTDVAHAVGRTHPTQYMFSAANRYGLLPPQCRIPKPGT
jgi:hypothetical protein